MSRLALTASFGLCVLTLGIAQGPVEFTGRLRAELVTGPVEPALAMTPVGEDARRRLGSLVADDDAVLGGALSFFGNGKRPIFLVVSHGTAAVITDLKGEGTSERIALVKTTDATLECAATLRLATPAAAFPSYPIRVGLRAGQLAPLEHQQTASSAPFYLSASIMTFAEGVVPVDGQSVAVRVLVDQTSFKADSTKNYQYVDANGDGQFDGTWPSWEVGVAHGAPVVFHVGTGNRYVSIASVDLLARTITLAARTAQDYPRIELRIGSVLPDFSFAALDGSIHHLSEYRGKYVLLDFWGTWCGPCVADAPFLKKIYETYRDKGFEILGMDNEVAAASDATAEDFAQGFEKVKAFVAAKGMTWLQARTESIKELSDTRFGIFAWPTKILIDPKGAIVFATPGMTGEVLNQTLAEIFKTHGTAADKVRSLDEKTDDRVDLVIVRRLNAE
jgi:thiol-disulfide isomerase/thioredoxin